MSWSQLHSGSYRHRKVIELARILGCSDLEARGLAMTLWSWTSETAIDGDLRGWSAYSLARAWGWTGDADKLVAALLEVRLLDGDLGSLCVHEWLDYCPQWRDAHRKAAEREAEKLSKNVQDIPGQSEKRKRASKKVRAERRERGEGEGDRDGEENKSRRADRSPVEPAPPSPPVISGYLCRDGSTWDLSQDLFDSLSELHAGSGFDVRTELLEAKAYVAGLAQRDRYTAAGMPAFLRGTLKRAATFAARRAGGAPAPRQESATQYAFRRSQELAQAEPSGPAQGVLRIEAKVERYSARDPPPESLTADLFGDQTEAHA